MKPTTYFHLFPRLQMSGVIPLPHLCAFVVCTGTASPSLCLQSSIFLTFILLTWRIWVPNNASKWQMRFNLAFKGLNTLLDRNLVFYMKVTFMEEEMPICYVSLLLITYEHMGHEPLLVSVPVSFHQCMDFFLRILHTYYAWQWKKALNFC